MNNKDKIKDFDTMSLREVVEITRNMTLTNGGMDILMEKFVREIEKLQNENPTT
jgi:hypothetical protein